jgi:hypothetical protein
MFWVSLTPSLLAVLFSALVQVVQFVHVPQVAKEIPETRTSRKMSWNILACVGMARLELLLVNPLGASIGLLLDIYIYKNLTILTHEKSFFTIL